MGSSYRSTRDAPPSHLRLKIESFSTLSNSSLKRYESSEFEADGHKWKLALYPNGNNNRGIKDHISLYLVLIDKNATNKVMQVNFTLFLYDHIRDNYLSVQDLSRFHELKYESGIDNFLSLSVFKNPSSGYLIEDTCVFGAEVFCIKNEPKVQCLSMVTSKPEPFKYTWKIENFSKLDKESYDSEIFTTKGHDWKMSVYPKGNGTGAENFMSLFLHLADSELLLDGRNVLAEFILRVVDQVGSKHEERRSTCCWNSSSTRWGRHEFLSLSALNKGTGYLVNDTCVVQADVIVIGSSK